jgi:hypothetical protein
VEIIQSSAHPALRINKAGKTAVIGHLCDTSISKASNFCPKCAFLYNMTFVVRAPLNKRQHFSVQMVSLIERFYGHLCLEDTSVLRSILKKLIQTQIGDYRSISPA